MINDHYSLFNRQYSIFNIQLFGLALFLAFFFLPGSRVTFGAVDGSPLLQLQESVNQAVARVRPSVVSIRAQKKKRATGDRGNGILWYESIGSGFILDERGFILTNYHVVEGAENIRVTLWRARQTEFSARVVHRDKSLDLAVLKIEGNERFSPAVLGDSDRVETGDWAISIGSPFGFEHSASLGIVSALHRDLVIGGVPYKDMIQTDAVINQGNSGGPLIDIQGRVIGVGTAIYAPGGTYAGLGFAIPINRTKHFFTRVTGAVTVALTAPAGPTVKNGGPIDLNKRMPRDLVHEKFTDCTECHSITHRRVSSLKAAITHPPAGQCDKCHVLVNDPVARGPVTVANVTPMTRPLMANPGFFAPFTSIILKLTLITLVISVVFTMLGVGGGFLYVPILLSSGIDFHVATTTSLVMLTTAQISALYIFFRSGLVDLRLGLVLEAPTMIGAFTGAMLSEHFNVNFLVILFACALFLASYSMMKDQAQLEGFGTNLRISPWVWEHSFRGHTYRVDLALISPLTFAVGFMGGLLGLAGGWLKVPLMVLLLGVPMKIAVATSSLMVPITGFSGLLGHSVLGHFELKLALSLSVLTIIGAQIGSRLTISTESNLLRFLFAFVLSLVGLWMILMVF